MRTVQLEIDLCVGLRHQGREPVARGFVRGLGDEAACDAALICDHDDPHASIAESPHGVGDAWEQYDAGGIAEVVPVLDQRAIPIQERYARLSHAR